MWCRLWSSWSAIYLWCVISHHITYHGDVIPIDPESDTTRWRNHTTSFVGSCFTCERHWVSLVQRDQAITDLFVIVYCVHFAPIGTIVLE